MKRMKLFPALFLILLMGLFAGTIYAQDSEKGTNVVEETYTKGDKTYECLSSENDNGYLQITQIVPNSQNVKISTYVDDNKLLISGVVEDGTEVTIKVFNEGEKKADSMYSMTSNGTFSQSLEIPEGKNKIVVLYKKDSIDDYVMFTVTRASEESIMAIKNFLVTA